MKLSSPGINANYKRQNDFKDLFFKYHAQYLNAMLPFLESPGLKNDIRKQSYIIAYKSDSIFSDVIL